ncbi:hypothetical protein TRIUR3_11977 [Triticum urartu]|uniref:Uncharacterized protein n=1 Tax=Triticum urartu TaxID=4572 RepID=M7ZZM9_TRIUA|nr:hypothetical protein TRIUR3_11977 [Triticum urartu]
MPTPSAPPAMEKVFLIPANQMPAWLLKFSGRRGPSQWTPNACGTRDESPPTQIQSRHQNL